jgi:hypothetical protein
MRIIGRYRIAAFGARENGPGDLRDFYRFRFVVDVQTVAIQSHRSQERILPGVGNNLRLVGFAEPIQEARKRLQLDTLAVRQSGLSGRLFH